mgnify:CR=1 FL=1
MESLEKKHDIILGIDPGTIRMGYAVIEASSRKPKLIAMGIINLSREGDHYQKLKTIFAKTHALILQYRPSQVALEAPFYGKNIQSMLKLGRAQGAAMAAGLQENLPIFEYAPRKIKLAITGKGNASKEEVARLLEVFMKFEIESKYLDSTDALAVAVCHYYQKNTLRSEGNYKNWEDFVKKNPGKINS